MIVGKRTVGATAINLAADFKRAFRVEVGAAKRISGAKLYVDGGGPGSGLMAVKLVVYDAATDALLGTGEELVIADGQAAGWEDLVLDLEGSQRGGILLPAAGEYDVGVIAAGGNLAARVYGDADAGAGRGNANTYTAGASDPFGASSVINFDMSLAVAVADPYSTPEGADDFLRARLPFIDAQRDLGRRAPLAATAQLAVAGWHGTRTDVERGSFAIAKTGTPLAEFVGRRVRVTTRKVARSRSVVALVHAEADVAEDVTLTRRLFLELEVAGRTRVDVLIEELGE